MPANSDTIDGATYIVDNAGNRTAKTDQRTAVATSYGYDSIYQLLSATQGATTTESYAYDAVGNRTSSLGVASYTTNSSNEMTANSNASFTYDYNGNTTSKTDSTGTTNYTWDFENRLTSVTLPGSGGTVTFAYDPLGRRIKKASASGTSVFAYDGDNPVEETNSSGGAVARYSQGLNIDEPLAMLRSGATSFYDADGLGSVTSLSSSTGSLAQTYTFDLFGKQLASSGSLTNPFQYTGRESDPETGLYYYRARYYDPTMGRFTGEDPAGFGGGINVYAYVKNQPTDFTDPTRLKCWQSSPWMEIPELWGPNGPKPYATVEDGAFWVRTGWSFTWVGNNKTECVCQWIATHSRVRKYYSRRVKEQAQFTCDCPSSTEYRTRDRVKNYEVDVPGGPFLSPEYGSTRGPTLQLSDQVSMQVPAANKTGNVTCLCLPPTP